VSVNRSVRRKREAALRKARKKAAMYVARYEANPTHENQAFAEAHVGIVGVMEAKMREDAE